MYVNITITGAGVSVISIPHTAAHSPYCPHYTKRALVTAVERAYVDVHACVVLSLRPDPAPDSITTPPRRCNAPPPIVT